MTDNRTDSLALLAQTGPGTLMGTLLRRFWQPVAIAADLAKGNARGLKVMGEELTLYRGESGASFLLAGHCAHRRTLLHPGWVEGDRIRCIYHGWVYDGSGRCVEIPAEKAPRSVPVTIRAYPLEEYCGVLFAWLGELPAPPFDLPRKHALEVPGRYVYTQKQIWDFNWFQQVENSLDSTHVSFVHQWGRSSRFDRAITTAIPELEYHETESGIRQIATRGDKVRVSDWTFPNNNHVITPGPREGDPWTHISVYAVPIDDHKTMRFTMHSIACASEQEGRRLAALAYEPYDPSEHSEALLERHEIGDIGDNALITAQDYVVLKGQGTIADRINENLSPSDAGIVLLRRIFLRELAAIREGRPTKAWRRLVEAAPMREPAK